MKIKSVYVASIITAFLLTGCNNQSAEIKNSANNEPGSYETNQLQQPGNIHDTHREINRQIESIPGVANASVVLYGDSIFIGLKKDARYQGSDYSLKQKVKQSMQGLARKNILYVVTDRDLYNRIDKISQRIQNRKPVGNRELNTLMNQVGLKVKPFTLIQKS
ncbi:YhcN/YlaJ family sporulation lipoprotein [Ammoniphilus resinae]|uniref:YhcN/YlaJ family sporulation lipoprotein n=1 Tax=Ammoniphilus resinae TaxID=861532 RepID=A0ABS4GQV9_9BACL|nr:YhcN/YlaJ family sporulation lipoprotein [Ammoniphilus resinae]MBP1932631.1 YhcN/YlaJ family sporulation lipoprotein [Ammoniphilus resinae]